MFHSDCLSVDLRCVVRRAALFTTLVLCGVPGWAAAEETPVTPLTGDRVNLTGEAFLKGFTGNPEEREKAAIYLLAISDLGEGKIWCDHKSIKTITAEEFVFAYFRKLSSSRLQEKAAILIEEALHASFPCGRSK
jgi:hypothetical protein